MKRLIMGAASLAIAACTPSMERGAQTRDSIGFVRDRGNDWLAATLNALARIPPDDWIELNKPEAIAVVREHFMPNDLLAPLAQPFQGQRVPRIRAHVGKVDVLRLAYPVLNWQIEVVLTSGMTFAWVDPAPAMGQDLPDRIRDMGAKLLRSPPTWFFFAPRPGETLRFSNDPSGEVHHQHRNYGYLDGGVIHSRLYLCASLCASRRASTLRRPPTTGCTVRSRRLGTPDRSPTEARRRRAFAGLAVSGTEYGTAWESVLVRTDQCIYQISGRISISTINVRASESLKTS